MASRNGDLPPNMHEIRAEMSHLRDRIDNLVNLARISAVINSSLDLSNLLDMALGVARQVVEAEGISLLLADKESDDLIFHVAEGSVGKALREICRVPKGSGICGWVYEHNEPIILNDAYQDSRFSPEFDNRTGYHTKSMMAFPLRVKQGVIGVALVVNKLGEGEGTSRVTEFTQWDVSLFSLFCDQLAVAIENAQLHQAQLRQQRLEMDLALAQEIQQSFLSLQLPDRKDYAFAARNDAALEVGGDLYDIVELGDGKIALALGDVAGKGVSAALYMARYMSELRREVAVDPEPRTLLDRLNRIICKQSSRGIFVTLFYGLVDPQEHTLTYGLAGHHEPVLIPSSEKPKFLAETNGIPLGVDESFTYDQEKTTLERGDMVIAFTDGVVEAQDPAAEFFSKEGLLACLSDQCSAGHPEDAIRRIMNVLRQYVGPGSYSDDVTLLAFTRNPETR